MPNALRDVNIDLQQRTGLVRHAKVGSGSSAHRQDRSTPQEQHVLERRNDDGNAIVSPGRVGVAASSP